MSGGETVMTADGGELAACAHVDIGIVGALGRITLDRPRALNALDFDMRSAIAEALPRFARDPQVYAILLRSTSPKAFSAGGDVRQIIAWAGEDMARARHAFAEEYRLDWQLECFNKPSVSLIDGMVMGSGVGLSAYNTHRVAAEGYRFAMPETAIGLFPDVGVAHVLARLPDDIGLYLGLTGHAIGRADAYALGLVTHCLPAAQFPEIEAGLADAWPVDPLLDDRHIDPGPGDLAPHRGAIARCFSAGSLPEILSRLAEVRGSDREWAQSVRTDLLKRSPTALAVTHRHIRGAAKLDLRQTLEVDYRLACRFLEGHDFGEGVRAALVDKDHSPRWRPERIEDVLPEAVEAFFSPLPDDPGLELPARSIMQEPRV